MKLFKINYNGLWLGGKALVLAEDEEQAISLVREDSSTVEFKNIVVEEIQAEGVIYNDNGDY